VPTGLAVLPTQEGDLNKPYSRDYQGNESRHLACGGTEITKRATYFVAITMIMFAMVAGFGVGQSLAYQRWINVLVTDAAMSRVATGSVEKSQEPTAMSAKLRRRLEAFLDLVEAAVISSDESDEATIDDDTEESVLTRTSR
jgi:hypothetical protein